jgi:hypothetical protein
MHSEDCAASTPRPEAELLQEAGHDTVAKHTTAFKRRVSHYCDKVMSWYAEPAFKYYAISTVVGAVTLRPMNQTFNTLMHWVWSFQPAQVSL